jgi:DNA mismatch repair ATPase MutL
VPSKSLPTTFSVFTGTADAIDASKRAILYSKVTKRKLRKIAEDLEGDEQEIAGVGDEEDDEMAPATKKKKKARDVTTKKVALTKSDFSKMEIVGQFNLGFILARDHRNQNLWILDQHGCDEIKNFERLIKDTKIHEQRLIAPLPLELSPSEEDTVIENMEIFEMNGFRFDYDETKPPRQRLSLTALPHSGSGGDGRTAVQVSAARERRKGLKLRGVI